MSLTIDGREFDMERLYVIRHGLHVVIVRSPEMVLDQIRRHLEVTGGSMSTKLEIETLNTVVEQKGASA